MAKRPADFDLRRALREPSFTPAVRDLPALWTLLAEDDDKLVADVERAVLRVGSPAIAAVWTLLDGDARPPLRARLVRIAGRAEPIDVDRLLRVLDDSDAKSRRNAILALGHVRDERRSLVESALIAHWARETRLDHRRSLATVLGKIGGPAARAHLDKVLDEGDPELARILAEARVRLARTDADTIAPLDGGGRVRHPITVALHCRTGVEPLLIEELGAGARVIEPGRVLAILDGPLDDLWRARTMLHAGFPLQPVERGAKEDLASAVARALVPAADEILAAFTHGPPRYRIEWAGAGKQRAQVFALARQLASLRPSWINDPSRRQWEFLVEQRGPRVHVELAPRRADPRFTYRERDVPAASHPTLAAALARIADVRPTDRAWDPFVGSGSELVEAARRAPGVRLVGSDIDPAAIAVARHNLGVAGVEAELLVGDALTLSPSGITLIITNPPMGRRVHTEGDLGALLDTFLARAALTLGHGGRIAWISPMGDRTARRAASVGLSLARSLTVDMGGFPATMQLLVRA